MKAAHIITIVLALLTVLPGVHNLGAAEGETALSAGERQRIEHGVRALTEQIETARRNAVKTSDARRDRLADVEVFAKGIAWALRYDTTFAPAEVEPVGRATPGGGRWLGILRRAVGSA